MTLKSINAELMKKAFLSAAQALDSKKDMINELNVFPVPDGDTGTNMTMTIMSAAREVNALEAPSMADLAKAVSSGSLRGARGNSGVILSQLLRGFTKVIRDYDEITVDIAANAFSKAVETAYKAVMKPKEGTILTVAKGGAEKAAELVGEVDDCIEFMDIIIAHMDEVLAYTPELLPVLKEAGVVDSGGQGLLEVMKGAFEALQGKEVVFSDMSASSTKSATVKTAVSTENISTSDIKFGYCTEFIILLEKEFTQADETEFKAFLESIGDSVVCVADDEVVKVHVHTNHPGQAFEKGLTYGQLSRMKVDNMREEHNEKLFLEQEKAKALDLEATAQSGTAEKAEESTTSESLPDDLNAAGEGHAAETENEPEKAQEMPHKEVGFVSVTIGDGINDIFKGLGVDYLIEGGQTMNPSTEDMLNAIDAVNADTIYILPNNKNIILAADQAKAMTEDKNIIVIPSKTVPQGIAALIAYVAGKSAEENEAIMRDAMKAVKTGQVTYAVRDTKIDGKEIRMGDYMGIDDHSISSVGTDLKQTTTELIESLIDEDSSLVSIYYGTEANEEQANEIAAAIEANHRMLDVEVHPGGQPVYYFIASVE